LQRVLMNPPFNDPLRSRASPSSRRDLAHRGCYDTLAAWVRVAGRLLQSSGTLTLIWRADGLDDVLRALVPPFGGATVLPVHPRPGKPAVRILVRAAKGRRAALALLPGFFLNDVSGRGSPEAEAVLREGAILPLAEI
jgi:tRNA1(Val) A37 N6-methylase TrmN6